MSTLLSYVVYALVFVGVVLAVEGVWLSLRGVAGEGRAIRQRLARLRRHAVPGEIANPVAEDWFERRLPWLSRNLLRARASFGPRTVVVAGLALVVAKTSLLALFGAPLAVSILAGLALGVGGPALLVSGLARRRHKRFLNQMPQAVDLIARSLQAGHPVTTAIAVVGKQMPDPIGPEFAVVIEEMTYGLERDQAMNNLVERFPSTELRMFVASLEVTRESGGNLSEVFLKLADSIRAKAQLRLKVEALSAEGRLSFWVVSSLPFLVGGAIVLLQPGYYAEVASDPLFWPMMAVAPVMLTLGAGTIWRMVNFKI
ncbi:type II secretion system F family protein [Phenylobacterium sp.]|uniref:type II secretion system F family protein n=1 Tax=Phenylobacterium sp. TaxID=1871053 RepID=UPI0028123F94|nr:type II secretion system F family protein [Phenylobacterium sp.]